MDFSTGIVGGPKRRISYQSIAEGLYVEPVPGRHAELAGSPSKKVIRNALTRLASEKPPLIVRRLPQDYLVFFLPLSFRDQSVQNRRGRGRAGGEDTPTGALSYDIPAPHEATPSDEGHTEIPRSGIHPVSDLISNLSSSCKSGGKESEVVAAAANDDFIPTTSEEWQSIFMSIFEYSFNRINSSKVISLFDNWCERRIPIKIVKTAVKTVRLRGKGKPGSPIYFTDIVNDLVTTHNANHSQTRLTSASPSPDPMSRIPCTRPGCDRLADRLVGIEHCCNECIDAEGGFVYALYRWGHDREPTEKELQRHTSRTQRFQQHQQHTN